jgi:hypothetical protein
MHKVNHLLDLWEKTFEGLIADGKRSPTSLDTYRQALKNHVRPALGELRVSERSNKVVALSVRPGMPGLEHRFPAAPRREQACDLVPASWTVSVTRRTVPGCRSTGERQLASVWLAGCPGYVGDLMPSPPDSMATLCRRRVQPCQRLAYRSISLDTSC